MNYQQYKYFKTLDRSKQDEYIKRLATLEANLLAKLFDNEPATVEQSMLNRLNKLTSYPKEISLECNLEDLDNLLEIDETLAIKESEIASKRRIIKSYINEILAKTIKK